MTVLRPDPYNEIIPGLFVGGHDYQPHDCPWPLDVIIESEFDLVLSLYTRTGHGPAEGVEHHHLRIPDGSLSTDDLDDVRRFADLAADAVRAGRKILIRCQAGINRSSLVAAFAMVRLGHTADEALVLLRAKRSPIALFNEHFQDYLAVEGARLAEGSADAA